MASVGGGVGGSRQSWLKSNGEIREFESLTEAGRRRIERHDERPGWRHHPIRSNGKQGAVTLGETEGCTPIGRAKARNCSPQPRFSRQTCGFIAQRTERSQPDTSGPSDPPYRSRQVSHPSCCALSYSLLLKKIDSLPASAVRHNLASLDFHA